MKTSKAISRYNPRIETGLDAKQIKERRKNKLTNKTKLVVGKSYAEIIFTNLLSFFNITLFTIAGIMIYYKLYDSLFFLMVLIPNTIIGLYQDIKARILMGKLKVLTAPKVTVVREGKTKTVISDDILLDDIIILKNSCQIPVDGVVLDGSVAVNESLLTGESDNIYKNPGDTVFSGSYVVSGSCYIRADKIGENCYAASLAGKAKKFRRSSSKILKSLKAMFRTISGVVIFMAAFMLITFYFQGRFNGEFEQTRLLVGKIAGSLVSMVPSGLYLLTSVALTLAVMTLGKKQAQVQDFYAVEMLARVDLLCVDKTGTITDGSMVVRDVIPLGGYVENDIPQLMANYLNATNDTNYTAVAMRRYFDELPDKVCSEFLQFNSDNKYSAATFGKDGTYVLGALEKINVTGKEEIRKQVEFYSSKGLRVLLLAKGKDPIKNNRYDGQTSPVCLVVLEDHVRDDAIKTFEWLQENKVGIKVISGDNAQAVSEIAKSAHIEGAEKYISLDGKTLDETYELATRYTVFGRVNPEQKETLVKAFKNHGKTVGMTGDGVNDILALKRADCSIAVASGSDAARNVSHIVLLDSNFTHLPEIVAEGRRVVNNLQRTSSVFLVKTLFSMVLTFLFTLLSITMMDKTLSYPFLTNNMYPWEIISIGLASFFLALQPNNEIITGSFLSNVFKKAIPAAIMMIGSVLIIFSIYFANINGVIYWQLDDLNVATSISCIVFNILSLVVLYRVCIPLDSFRKKVFILITCLVAVLIGFSAVMSLTGHDNLNILKVVFNNISPLVYLIGLATLVGCAGLFLGIYAIFDRVKESKQEHGENS